MKSIFVLFVLTLVPTVNADQIYPPGRDRICVVNIGVHPQEKHASSGTRLDINFADSCEPEKGNQSTLTVVKHSTRLFNIGRAINVIAKWKRYDVRDCDYRLDYPQKPDSSFAVCTVERPVAR